MRRVVAGGTVVTAGGSQRADVVIADGRIVALQAPESERGGDVLDATDCLVLPGGVDPHVHFDSPTQKVPVADDVTSGTVAAAFGGTTTVIDFAFQLGDMSVIDAIERARARSEGRAVVDYSLHAVLTRADESTLATLEDAVSRGVTSFKLYMAYERRGLLMRDDAIFKVMRRARDVGALVMLHAENGPLTELLVEEAVAAGHVGPSWHPVTRPELTEIEAVYRGISIAELADAPVYFVHISTSGGVEHIAAARRRGRPVFGETCPHYLLLDDSVYAAAGFDAAKWVLTPPIRSKANQESLWTGLRNRDLQTVATDHCPFCFAGGKDAGKDDFSKIPNGGPGIEHRLTLLYDAAVASGCMSVERWVELVATAPARLFGLAPRKGEIAIGSDADLVIFDPAGQTIVSAATQHSKVDYSMYEGRKLKGAVRTVLSRGETIVRDGELVAAPGRGCFVVRGMSGTTF